MFEAGLFPPNPSYEETTTFWLMCIGTIAAVFVYAPSKPYSKSIFNNCRLFIFSFIRNLVMQFCWLDILMVWAVESFALTLCLMFITNQTFVNFLNFKSPPNVEYSLMILLLGIASGLWCFIWEVENPKIRNVPLLSPILFIPKEILYSRITPAVCVRSIKT